MCIQFLQTFLVFQLCFIVAQLQYSFRYFEKLFWKIVSLLIFGANYRLHEFVAGSFRLVSSSSSAFALLYLTMTIWWQRFFQIASVEHIFLKNLWKKFFRLFSYSWNVRVRVCVRACALCVRAYACACVCACVRAMMALVSRWQLSSKLKGTPKLRLGGGGIGERSQSAIPP